MKLGFQFSKLINIDKKIDKKSSHSSIYVDQYCNSVLFPKNVDNDFVNDEIIWG